jgi:hypothetical protein
MPDMSYIHRSRTEEEKEQWLEQSHVTLTQNSGPDLNCKDYPVTAIAMPIQVVFRREDPLINNRKTPFPIPPSQPLKDLTPLAKPNPRILNTMLGENRLQSNQQSKRSCTAANLTSGWSCSARECLETCQPQLPSEERKWKKSETSGRKSST